MDSVLQEQFFDSIQQQLDGVNSFFRAREAELAHHLRELEGEVGRVFVGFSCLHKNRCMSLLVVFVINHMTYRIALCVHNNCSES